MKMTSRFALVAAAATLLGAYSANAADLGGGCCADLEERVAELEATTARKGNRVVSLQVYGQVGRGILAYDSDTDISATVEIEDEDSGDTEEVDVQASASASDTTLIDEDGSEVGFTGSATIKPGLSAGYRIELEINDEQGDAPGVKHNHLWIESEQLGRVTLGQASTATDGIAHIVLANTYSDSGAFQGGFYSDLNTISLDFSPVFTFDAVLASYTDFDGGRGDVIRYDSPSIGGFIVSASWSDDLKGTNPSEDYFDVTLRYSGEFNTLRIAAGVGYTDNHAGEEILQGSASIMHVPTGLFAAFSAGDIDQTSEDYWYVTGGIEKTWLSVGKTTVYGEYGEYAGAGASGSLAFFSDGAIVDVDIDVDGDETMWGAGIVQSFDAAAMDIYLQYRHVEGEFNGADIDVDTEFDTVVLGTKIAF